MKDHSHQVDRLAPESHEPNFAPPYAKADISLLGPDGTTSTFKPEHLSSLPRSKLSGCFIVSTGHGTSGPFEFEGVTLRDLVQMHFPKSFDWAHLEILAADGFGTRVRKDEIYSSSDVEPILLADTIDNRPMTRDEGLIRLIVPSERVDALRQVKWISQIRAA